ncbi:unnamed protein product [Caenorhabditis nigoni]
MTAITTIPLNYSTASRGFCLRRHRVLSASRQYRTEAVRCNMSAENQENRGLPTKKAKFGDGSVGMTEKTARGIRSPLSSSENNIEHVQTASVADTASSTSNIFNTTEERAMTAEEEEEKTARDRRGRQPKSEFTPRLSSKKTCALLADENNQHADGYSESRHYSLDRWLETA